MTTRPKFLHHQQFALFIYDGSWPNSSLLILENWEQDWRKTLPANIEIQEILAKPYVDLETDEMYKFGVMSL